MQSGDDNAFQSQVEGASNIMLALQMLSLLHPLNGPWLINAQRSKGHARI